MGRTHCVYECRREFSVCVCVCLMSQHLDGFIAPSDEDVLMSLTDVTSELLPEGTVRPLTCSLCYVCMRVHACVCAYV